MPGYDYNQEVKTTPHFEYEKKHFDLGYKFIAGIDEVGRGPLAGPVVAATIILPLGTKNEKRKRQNYGAVSRPDLYNIGINDSKKMSEKKRVELDKIIREAAVDYGIGESSVGEIDKLGIQTATYLAYKRAIEKLKDVDFLLIDGLRWKNSKLPYESIIKGDSISMSIAAASIIAKVYRDNLMCELAVKYPEYGFEKHKGYGTKSHFEALKRHGPCEIHRKSFAPIGKYC